MTTTKIHLPRLREQPAGRAMPQTTLLACGIVSSVLYVATDLLGGLTYDGYSFIA